MPNVACIYCGIEASGKQSKAHIFAESTFGDHEYLFLAKGEVCAKCNQRISPLEAALKDRMGLLLTMVGSGRTKRGWTKINAPGIGGDLDPKNPRIAINLGKKAWTTSDGLVVRPALRKGERVEVVHGHARSDGLKEFNVSQEIRVDSDFVRVLAKIGFETICFHRGADYCRDLRWHRLRRFILDGVGERTYFFPKEVSVVGTGGEHVRAPVGVRLRPFSVTQNRIPSEEWVAHVTIGTTFTVDLSPDNLLIPALLDGPLLSVRDQFIVKTCKAGQRPGVLVLP